MYHSGNINIQDFNVVTFTGRGKVPTGGILFVHYSRGWCIYGSNTRFLVNLTPSTLHTQIYLRTVSGVIAAHADSDLTFSLLISAPTSLYYWKNAH